MMKVYMARQAIYTSEESVFGYELLYRESLVNAYNPGMDGNVSTRAVLSDAITTFGINNLTQGKYAFVNFTKDLIMSDIPNLLNPQRFVIEILEDVQIDEELLRRILELKQDGYMFAMDDYIGDEMVSALFMYTDIIKIDFAQLEKEQRKMIAQELLPLGIQLLAEKVETQEDYVQAVEFGYTLFQGYFFSKPRVFVKSTVEIINSIAMQVLQELKTEIPSYWALSKLVRQDVNFTYKLLNRINTMEYYRGHKVVSVQQALIRMGIKEILRWTMLMLMRESLGDQSAIYAKTALMRAVFLEQIAAELGCPEKMEDAFTVGMFSIIDAVIDESMPIILEELCVSEDVKQALLGGKNYLRKILDFAIAYENGQWDEIMDIIKDEKIDMEKVRGFYFESVSYADKVISES